MPSRRPHQKTRHGCIRCKQRKVKCDEERPICRNCSRIRADCSFVLDSFPLSPAYSEDVSSTGPRTPANDIVRPPIITPALQLSDLELMHHWSTVTCFTI